MKNESKGKKEIGKGLLKACYSMIQIITLKAMTWGMFWVYLYSQTIYQIVPYPQNFLPIKFFPSVIFKYLASNYLKKYCEPMQWGTQLMPVQV